MKYTVAKAPLAHGRQHDIGDEIEMSEADAKPLVDRGRLVKIKEKAAPKPSNKAAPKPSNKSKG